MSAAETYARWVLEPENARRNGQFIKLAAKRFLSDMERDDIYFDEHEGDRIVKFSESYLCLWEDKWRGKPMDVRPWMAFILQQIFGWYRRSDGLRRVRTVYVQIAKKNAKSTIAGVLNAFHVFADPRMRTPQVFVGANNEDQAKICVNITGNLIANSPGLIDVAEEMGRLDLFRYKENIVNIVYEEHQAEDGGPGRKGFIKALSKEGSDKKSKTAGGKHGLNPSLGVIDEYGMAADDNLYNTLESAQAAREEPLIFCITTAGFNMEGPCYRQLRESGIGVLNGTLPNDSFLPFIFELDKPVGDDGKEKEITCQWLLDNEETWEQCNPNIDVSVFREFLRQRLQAARNEGGTKEVDVKTLNFNLWVDSPEVFIPSEVWNANTHGGKIEDLKGRRCYGGIEIINSKVLNAFVLIFPDVNGKTCIKPLFWMPSAAVRKDGNPEKFEYGKWADSDMILTSQGNVVDNTEAFEWIMREISQYSVDSVAVKSTLLMNDIVQALVKNGVEVNPISHGYQGISTPTKGWEEILTSHDVEHYGNPVLAWMNGNCMVVRKDDDIRLEKAGSRVVGIYAAINAFAQWKTKDSEDMNDQNIESW